MCGGGITGRGFTPGEGTCLLLQEEAGEATAERKHAKKRVKTKKIRQQRRAFFIVTSVMGVLLKAVYYIQGLA